MFELSPDQVAEAAKLLHSFQHPDSSPTQSLLLRPGTVDFQLLIDQMQKLQIQNKGDAAPDPETTPESLDPAGMQKEWDAKSMPPPTAIPTRGRSTGTEQEAILPATRPNSPAPPSVAERAAAAKPPDASVVEAAAKEIQVRPGKTGRRLRTRMELHNLTG